MRAALDGRPGPPRRATRRSFLPRRRLRPAVGNAGRGRAASAGSRSRSPRAAAPRARATPTPARACATRRTSASTSSRGGSTAASPTQYDKVKSVQVLPPARLRVQREAADPAATRWRRSCSRTGSATASSSRGAMALMLRMDGIPARVAARLRARQLRPRRRKEYSVRDLDAHSWVEVWFSGIGWVPFDPTPSLAPASSQSDSVSAASAARGAARRPRRHREPRAAQRRGQAAGAGGGRAATGRRLEMLAVRPRSLLAAGRRSAIAAVGDRRSRAPAAPPRRAARARVRRAARAPCPARLRVPARTTLAELERRLSMTAGPGAAALRRGLRRRQRYAPPGAPEPPTAHDRRALRAR